MNISRTNDRGHAPLNEAPAFSRARLRINLFIAGFLLLQIVIPLGYYLGGDPYDERFAWRMFSAVRMTRCETRVEERSRDAQGHPRSEQPDLTKVVHQAWIHTLERGRPAVIRAFLRRRCREPGMEEVTLVNSCLGADGRRKPPLTWVAACKTGILRQSG